MKQFNWGIIGPGKIAHKFASALLRAENARIYTILSRSRERAENFGKKYGASRMTDDMDEMLNDPCLDVVYIATPHSHHFDYAQAFLERGIPVLCEKPVTINLRQFTRLVETAKNKNVFFMEALWTRFLPTIETMLEILGSQVLGKVRVLQADFGFKAEYDPESRLFNPDLGGGSLLDIGIYPVFLSLLILGYPDEIKAVAHKAETGVDESIAISLLYKSGAIASLYSTFTVFTGTTAELFCEKGQIHINSRWFAPSSISVKKNGQAAEEMKFQYDFNGYEYEIREVMSCIENGLKESPRMSLAFSLSLMKLLDEIRKECNIHYPLYD